MKSSKPVFLFVGLGSVALLAAALYLQLVLKMLPCPLCVLQRYAFAILAICCLLGALMPRGAGGVAAGFGIVATLAGAATAGWHLYIKANPAISCGIDPLETSLNTIPTARMLPLLFQADGLCSTDYPPILGLSIPQWSLLWFAVFAIALATVLMRRRQR